MEIAKRGARDSALCVLTPKRSTEGPVGGRGKSVLSNNCPSQPAPGPDPADVPLCGTDPLTVEGPSCHGVAGDPRPRGAAQGGRPGPAGAGGRAQVSVAVGASGSCAGPGG